MASASAMGILAYLRNTPGPDGKPRRRINLANTMFGEEPKSRSAVGSESRPEPAPSSSGGVASS